MRHELLARDIGPARIDLCYERRGDPGAPTVLLVMGLATQLVHWPEGLVDALVARGLHVVRFDNRDSGRSTHMIDAPTPDFAAAMAGDFTSASYTLSDMAADAVGLLDALGIDAAHVVGASMGGAIGQLIAIEHPRRARSLTSIMSTTGDPAVGQVHPETARVIFGGPPVRSREDHVARSLRARAATGSPGFPSDANAAAETAGIAYDRAHDELAIVRQAIATLASGDRTSRLRALDVPTLVVHGLADTLCDPSGGRATAAAIPGAELALIEGMGHDLPQGVWSRLVDLIDGLVRRADARERRASDG
ncbi:MAG: alpha/beta fold hydrolase [Deltaproteobacteria bacterium]|nr:alpha/beta fold hydrolase [Deltaproteobacteria bacterium]